MAIDFVVEPIRWTLFPLAASDSLCRSWLMFQSQRGLSRNTLEAYCRGLEIFLRFLTNRRLALGAATHAEIGAYLATLQSNNAPLCNATVQQRLTVLRLFYGYLVEEGVCARNPVIRHSGRSLVRRYSRLPWIPNEADWRSILAATVVQPIRNRTMLAFAYDAALRREELCALHTDDIDPSSRTLRIRAENTKGRRDRVVPYSSAADALFLQYLVHRRNLSRKRGPLFLSESRRNFADGISIWSWSKIILQIARRAAVPCFTTHSLRHLCLTDLARADWDIHEIAAFAGHRSIQTTLLYVHLSGRDLSRKLAAGMAHIHEQRMRLLAGQTK